MVHSRAEIRRLDRIRNDTIRQRFGICLIADQLREARIWWCPYVLRGSDDTVRKIGPYIFVPWVRPNERPKQRWLDSRLHVDWNP